MGGDGVWTVVFGFFYVLQKSSFGTCVHVVFHIIEKKTKKKGGKKKGRKDK